MPAALKTSADGHPFHARTDPPTARRPAVSGPTGSTEANGGVTPTVGAGVAVPATIGSLVSELKRIISELEKHTSDMNYPGADEFNAHTFPATRSTTVHTKSSTTSPKGWNGQQRPLQRRGGGPDYAALTPGRRGRGHTSWRRWRKTRRRAKGERRNGCGAPQLGRQLGRHCRRNRRRPAAATSPSRGAGSAVARSKR